jgi:hypothetical protein
VTWSEGIGVTRESITDAKGRLQESLARAHEVKVTLSLDLGALEFVAHRNAWKIDSRGRTTVEVDAYARVVVYAKCGDDLCKFGVVDAHVIPPLPDLTKLEEARASLIASRRDTDPMQYLGLLKWFGLLGEVPTIARQYAFGQSAELLIPYDGDVYVEVQAATEGQAATLVNTRRGTSTVVTLSIDPAAVVAGVVVNDDGTPARRHDIYVATRASFPPGDFTGKLSTMFQIAKATEPGSDGGTKETIHYKSMTDSEGLFSIPVAFTGEVCAYAFTTGGRLNMVTKVAKSKRASVRQLELKLSAPTASLRKMRFIQTDGRPLAKTDLRAGRTGDFGFDRPEWRFVHPLSTDGDGWADVSGLNAGAEYRFDDTHVGISVVPVTESRVSNPTLYGNAKVRDGEVVTLVAQRPESR